MKLQHITQAIHATLDLNDVLHCLVAETVPLLGAQSGLVTLYNETRDEAEVLTSYGTALSPRCLRYPLAGSLAGWVAVHQCPLRVWRLTPEEWPTAWTLGEQLGASPIDVSVLHVPLLVQDKAIGSLAVVWKPCHLITDNEEWLLQAVAVQAAIAITNARLFQEKEQALQDARENEAWYRSLFENANDAIATFTLDGTITRVNRWAELLLGWSREELIGQHFRMVVTPASVTLSQERTRRWQVGETLPAVFELELVCKDGTVVPVEARTRVIRDSAGTARGFQGIFRDISARKQTEAALLRLSSAVQTSTDSIVITDIEGKIVEVNDATLHMYGTTDKGDLLGKSAFDLIAPEERATALAGMQEVLEQEAIGNREYTILLKNGHTLPVEMNVALMRDTEGNPVGFVGISRDITERKRAEQRMLTLLAVAEDINGMFDLGELLSRVERRTAATLPCDLVATFLWDPNREVFRLVSSYGLPPELRSAAEALCFPPGQPFGGRLTRGQPVVINDIAQQSWVPVDLFTYFHVVAFIAVPLLGRDREIGTLVACATTEGRRFAPREVEFCYGIARQLAIGIEASELYHQQQEEAEIAGALARVGHAMIASLNAPEILQRLCHLTTEELGCDCSHTLLWQPEEEAYRVVAGCGDTPEQWEIFRVLKLPRVSVTGLAAHLDHADLVELTAAGPQQLVPEGLLHHVEITATLCIALRRGREVIGVQAASYRGRTEFSARQKRIARGISQLASLALANAHLLEELDRANRVKEDFMGIMSHELRTPLNVILGYSEFLLEEGAGSLSQEQEDLLRRLDTRARALLDLVNATLDLSRLQNQQRLPLTLQEVSISTLFSELAAETQALPPPPTVTVEWQLTPLLPLLQTDSVKLKMVLKNLVTNAVKFTEKGRVTIVASPCGEGVEFTVTDTGIGIAPKHLGLIFEPFQQVSTSRNRPYGGAGLGLYIVRQLCQLLGGKVTVESEVGQGSRFCVWIPQSFPSLVIPTT